jgi:hypothetical protein
MHPEPLPTGQLLSERFEIHQVLGRGGFAIAYLAKDLVLEDLVAVKELAPEGSRRGIAGLLELQSGGSSPQLLRQRFLEEARTLAKLNIRGVLPVRASFSENGTAYYVTEYQPNTETLERMLHRERQLDLIGALDIFLALLDIVEAVHERGLLHRDIKPSNILISKTGHVTLIDFGAARGFHVDAAHTHTVMYTPGYAPPEQLSERARRGPATDYYALCATLYHMLTGTPPEDSAARVAGVSLRPVRQLRPDVDPSTERLLEKGLAVQYADRPQTVAEIRRILAEEEPLAEVGSIEALDQLLVKMANFRYVKRACPACDSVLLEARPLRRGACPVCRRGTIRSRKVDHGLCPVCKLGALKPFQVGTLCPCCSKGMLAYRRKGILSKEQVAQCPSCDATFDVLPDKMVERGSGEARTATEWHQMTGRAEKGALCNGCAASFDELSDGRWRQMTPKPNGRYVSLYPEEWDRVAAGLEPGAGNGECDTCGADYYLETDSLTLLDAPSDPNGFATDYLGRLLSWEDARWLGVGKESALPGLVCERCPLELDHDGAYLRLIRTDSRELVRFQGQPKTLEDWQRLGLGLPTVDQEDRVSEELAKELREAYWFGKIGFDEIGGTAWKGEAVRLDDNSRGTLQITGDEVFFGGLLRKWKVPRDAVLNAEGKDSRLQVLLSGEREWLEFEISPATLYVQLQSGEYRLSLDAGDLAKRLK